MKVIVLACYGSSYIVFESVHFLGGLSSSFSGGFWGGFSKNLAIAETIVARGIGSVKGTMQ